MKTTKLYTMVATYAGNNSQAYTISGDAQVFARMIRANRHSEIVTGLEIIIQDCYTLRHINEVYCDSTKYIKIK